jgi:hypothetical protein
VVASTIFLAYSLLSSSYTTYDHFLAVASSILPAAVDLIKSEDINTREFAARCLLCVGSKVGDARVGKIFTGCNDKLHSVIGLLESTRGKGIGKHGKHGSEEGHSDDEFWELLEQLKTVLDMK